MSEKVLCKNCGHEIFNFENRGWQHEHEFLLIRSESTLYCSVLLEEKGFTKAYCGCSKPEPKEPVPLLAGGKAKQ